MTSKNWGKQLKKIGMLVVQDQVWNRVTINRAARKSTRYYIDEMHLLLKEETDRRLHGGDLEAVQKVGRNPDRDYAERQGPAFFPRGGEHL